MIGLSLVLLVGGAPGGNPARAMGEVRLAPAIVVPAAAPAPVPDPGPEEAAAPMEPVRLRRAVVVRTPVRHKER